MSPEPFVPPHPAGPARPAGASAAGRPAASPATDRAAVAGRTVAATADVLFVLTPTGGATVALTAVDGDGGLLLLVAEADPLVAAVRASEVGGLSACVEAKALTPAPLPDRVLAALWLRGVLEEVRGAPRRLAARALAARAGLGHRSRQVADVAAGEAVLRLAVSDGEVVEGPQWRGFGGDAWAAARPDPVAEVAPALVGHLPAGHAAELAVLESAALARLPREVGVPLRRPVLVGLDRAGCRWRCVTAGGAVDVRLDFARPVTDPADLPAAVRSLVAATAGGCCGVRECDG